uniref:NADH-ubiquinone oxidoreductase chain 2 n=1 Tax=Cherax quinquecarinatus TaxID=99753 RepID=W6MVV3_CHEQN|nr:NADH dehydrogenase subunit 2 [Cherax quinquecarinatus]CDL72614.1 NADH dehydrogenase subunit 2 [Cherax quinquecarinatus]
MPFSSYKIMFSISLISGTFLSISSSSWFSAWIGLELNLMSFIPLISSKDNQLPAEAALKYFLIQALGSAIIILSSSLTPLYPEVALLLISLALLLKLGAAPFHFWFPQVMEGLNWTQAIILMTIQKLAPMFLISYLTMELFTNASVFASALTCAIIGALGGINQTSLRKILSYSSINHMSWMLIAMLINETSWIIYFILYALISSSIGFFFLSTQSFYFSHLVNSNMSPLSKITSVMSLYSLGGMPPFSGFIPKWIIIQEMILSGFLFSILILLLSSLVTLYFYIRLTLSSISVSYAQSKWNLTRENLNTLSTPLWGSLNLFGLLIPSSLLVI